jgi:hypothetical protein
MRKSKCNTEPLSLTSKQISMQYVFLWIHWFSKLHSATLNWNCIFWGQQFENSYEPANKGQRRKALTEYTYICNLFINLKKTHLSGWDIDFVFRPHLKVDQEYLDAKLYFSLFHPIMWRRGRERKKMTLLFSDLISFGDY